MEKGQKRRILAIETSCDETACSVVEQDIETGGLNILSHQVHSQAKLHAEFGGVFPNLAKREHGKNFIPVLSLCLATAFGISIPEQKESDKPSAESNSPEPHNPAFSPEKIIQVRELLKREQDLAPAFITYLSELSLADFNTIKENLSGIAVTYGPGLEPALWVGVSSAKALAIAFDLPLFPINHMEGHIASVLASTSPTEPQNIAFPAIALLISGGHTELVKINSWHEYTLIGQTVDDAVGEAYDKVARLVGLPYPGGPEISKLAEIYRNKHSSLDNVNKNEKAEKEFNLPRPMIYSKDLQFSFSGLKTATLYAVRDAIKEQNNEPLSDLQKEALAAEFEQAVVDVLISKTKKAILEHGAQTLIIGGGVISNHFIRAQFKVLAQETGISLSIPETVLATDNASMIGLVALLQMQSGETGIDAIKNTENFNNLAAKGNLSFPLNITA